MKVRALLVGALLWCASTSVAFAQCGGQAASGYACGNGAASQGFASFYPLSTLFDRGIGSGQGTILNRTNTGWVATIAPTLGIPGTSQGTMSFAGATSGTATITAQATAGSPTITLPNASGTVADGASSPLVLNATTGNLTCPTCVTSSGGGGITGVSPVNVSAAGAVSLQGATGSIAVGSGGTGSSFTPTPTLGVAGTTIGTISLANTTSGTVTVEPAAGALGTAVATLPAGTYNLVGDNLTQTLTNKTINGSSNTLTVLAGSQLSGQTTVANGGTGLASQTANAIYKGAGTSPEAVSALSDNGTQVSSSEPFSLSGALTYGGVTLSNSVTGTGSMVLGTSPSLSNLTVTGSLLASGLVTYSDLATAALATSAQYIAGTSSTLVPSNVAYTAETITTYGATTTFDFSTFINTAVTLTGNITTMNVSNVKAGQAGNIRFIQDATGSRTAVWNSVFKFAGGVTPTLSTAPNAVDVLFYSCVSATLCYASLSQNMK